MYIGLFYITGYGKPYMGEYSVMNWILLPLIMIPTTIFFYRWCQLMLIQLLCLYREQHPELFDRLIKALGKLGTKIDEVIIIDEVEKFDHRARD
jgi:hypothetical protein